jgi:general stress protein YciG
MTEKSTHEKRSEAGRKGGEASHGGRGSSSKEEMALHEKRVEAGRAGGEAPHECRGRECTHPSHKKESGSEEESTKEKRSAAGRKGAEAQPTEAKRKGGEHSHSGRD